MVSGLTAWALALWLHSCCQWQRGMCSSSSAHTAGGRSPGTRRVLTQVSDCRWAEDRGGEQSQKDLKHEMPSEGPRGQELWVASRNWPIASKDTGASILQLHGTSANSYMSLRETPELQKGMWLHHGFRPHRAHRPSAEDPDFWPTELWVKIYVTKCVIIYSNRKLIR